MPKVKISEYSTTNADNTDIEGINIAEGCAPSGINNAIRELMVHLKEFQTGASGDGFTFAGGVLISGTTNTISGNVIMSGNLNSSGTNTFSGATVISNTLSGVTQLNVDNLRLDGNTLSSTDTNGNVSISPNGNGSVVVSSAGTSDALRITQTGSGNALLVEDSTNPDSSPFVVDANGRVIAGYTQAVTMASGVSPLIQTNGIGTGILGSIGMARWDANANSQFLQFTKSRSGTIGTFGGVVSSGDLVGTIQWSGDDGTSPINLAQISAVVDGTPGTNDMPGRLVFSTTADGASSPTERMRINAAGEVGIGTTSTTGYNVRVRKNSTGATTTYGVAVDPAIQTDVSGAYYGYLSGPSTAASSSLSSIRHFEALQGTFGASTTVTNQYGFIAGTTLTGATNNYGFYSNIASGTGRWNFYAAGTADNYFAGNVGIGTTSPGSALNVKGTLRLSGSSSGYVGIAPAAAAGSTTYTLPSADGTSGQVLSTNGSGTLSWASGGSSQWTTTGSDIYYTTGKVGVGVSTFTANGGKLEVSDGVTFPATQSACSNANTLDDYEEGTWTPAISRLTTEPTGVTYSERGGIYIKIGRQVWASFDLTVSSISTAGSGQNRITGLPFSSDVNDSTAGFPAPCYRASGAIPVGPTATTVVAGYLNGTYIYLAFDNIGNAGSGTNSSIDANWLTGRVTAWVTYRTAN